MTPLVRKLWIALAVSLALNLFMFGFWVARRVGAHHHDERGRAGVLMRERHMRGGHGFGPYASELGPERRELMKAQRRALAEAQRAVTAGLIAEPFDRAALESALQALRARQGTATEAAHAALVELAAKLDAAGRRALAERVPGMGGGRGRP